MTINIPHEPLRSVKQRTRGVFLELAKREDFKEKPKKKVAIFAAPRSGSNMFCSVLKNTGGFGNPIEWFNDRHLYAYLEVMGKQQLDVAEYLDFLFKKTISSNGLFSIKILLFQYSLLLKEGFNLLDLGFDKSYYLYREDKVAQAYSFSKALKTDQWIDEHEPESISKEIDRVDILERLVRLEKGEIFYDKYLKQYVDREFVYEEFRDIKRSNSYSLVLDDLGVEYEKEKLCTSRKKQSGDIEDRPLQEFREWIRSLSDRS